LAYVDCTWEFASDLVYAQAQIERYLERREVDRRIDVQVWDSRRHRKWRRMQHQPLWLSGGELRDYQLEGLNWLNYIWTRRTNGILADEMGLGKTIQCIAILAHLMLERGIPGPFLIVAPLSTVPAWQRELEKWAPFMHTVSSGAPMFAFLHEACKRPRA
jgi:chromodomain-helicase-DNA-binding protein 1